MLLHEWNGIRLIQPHRATYIVYADASGTKGIGGWFDDHAFSAKLPPRRQNKHINWKETYAILYNLAKWGSLKGATVIAMCDNETMVDALNKRTIHGETIYAMQWIL